MESNGGGKSGWALLLHCAHERGGGGEQTICNVCETMTPPPLETICNTLYFIHIHVVKSVCNVCKSIMFPPLKTICNTLYVIHIHVEKLCVMYVKHNTPPSKD